MKESKFKLGDKVYAVVPKDKSFSMEDRRHTTIKKLIVTGITYEVHQYDNDDKLHTSIFYTLGNNNLGPEYSGVFSISNIAEDAIAIRKKDLNGFVPSILKYAKKRAFHKKLQLKQSKLTLELQEIENQLR